MNTFAKYKELIDDQRQSLLDNADGILKDGLLELKRDFPSLEILVLEGIAPGGFIVDTRPYVINAFISSDDIENVLQDEFIPGFDPDEDDIQYNVNFDEDNIELCEEFITRYLDDAVIAVALNNNSNDFAMIVRFNGGDVQYALHEIQN